MNEITSHNPKKSPSENISWGSAVQKLSWMVAEGMVEDVNFYLRGIFSGRGDAIPHVFDEGSTVKGSSDGIDKAVSGFSILMSPFSFSQIPFNGATKTGMGLADNFLASATKSWGDQGLTVAGRALQKHAGRDGSVFQGIKFSHKTANQDGLNIINQIMGSKNQIIQQAENGGRLIFDKTTGRGFGVPREGLFNGFRELGK